MSEPVKCAQCGQDWHYECEHPHGDEHPDLCCCHTLRLWFDQDGVERWPDGRPYLQEAASARS